MSDEAFDPPPGASAEYQFGMLFGHAKRTDARFREVREDMVRLHGEVQAIPDKIMAFVNTALAAQTAELKPVVTEKMVRDANAAAAILAATNRREDTTVFWQRAGVLVAVVSVIFGVIVWVVPNFERHVSAVTVNQVSGK